MKSNPCRQDFRQSDLLPRVRDEQILKRVRLEAESALGAWYELTLVATKIGYLIEKHSGAQGRGQQVETWFRRDLADPSYRSNYVLTVPGTCIICSVITAYDIKEGWL